MVYERVIGAEEAGAVATIEATGMRSNASTENVSDSLARPIRVLEHANLLVVAGSDEGLVGDDAVVHQHATHLKQTAWAASVNLIKAIFGAASFALPWGFQQAGLLAGVLGVAFMGLSATLTIQMLVRSKRTIQEYAGFEADYSEVAAFALGRWWGPVVQAATAISCLGACAGYLTFLAGLVEMTDSGGLSHAQVIMTMAPLFVVLSWLRDFKDMAVTSLIGDAACFLAAFVIFYDGVGTSGSSSSSESHPFPLVRPGHFFLFFGPTAFLFTIHYCALPIEAEMQRPEQFERSLQGSLFFSTVLNVLIGAAGYMAFKDASPVYEPATRSVLPGCPTDGGVCDNVLKNVEAGPLRAAAAALLFVDLMFTFLVLMAPPRIYAEDALLRLLRRRTAQAELAAWQRNALRSMLVGGTVAVAAMVPSFESIVGLTGSITDTLQAFILPPVIYVVLHNKDLSPWTRRGCYAITAFGITMMIICTVQSIESGSA